jgi:ribosomal-protein-alanine N-acetyltransferase
MRSSDVSAFHVAFSDPEVMRYEGSAAHTTLAQTRETIHRYTNQMRKAVQDADGLVPNTMELTIEAAVSSSSHASDPTPIIGKTCLYWMRKRYWIGYLLMRSRWGQGYATEATGAMLETIFSVHPVLSGSPTKIWADVDPRNAGSLNVLRKLGFIEAERAYNTMVAGQLVDSVYLCVTKEAFQRCIWRKEYLSTRQLPEISFFDESVDAEEFIAEDLADSLKFESKEDFLQEQQLLEEIRQSWIQEKEARASSSASRAIPAAAEAPIPPPGRMARQAS